MGAEFKKYDEPQAQDILKDFKPRLPRYVTRETARAMGYSDAAIKTLHPDTTHIAYPEDRGTMLKQKLKYEFRNTDRQAAYIPSYAEGTYRIKGEANPDGSGPLMQVHVNKAPHPRSQWHTTTEVFESISRSAPQDTGKTFQRTLELSRTPTHSSVAFPQPYKVDPVQPQETTYMAEISFNGTGTEQIKIDPIDHPERDSVIPVTYKDTKPLP